MTGSGTPLSYYRIYLFLKCHMITSLFIEKAERTWHSWMPNMYSTYRIWGFYSPYNWFRSGGWISECYQKQQWKHLIVNMSLPFVMWYTIWPISINPERKRNWVSRMSKVCAIWPHGDWKFFLESWKYFSIRENEFHVVKYDVLLHMNISKASLMLHKCIFPLDRCMSIFTQ